MGELVDPVLLRPRHLGVVGKGLVVGLGVFGFASLHGVARAAPDHRVVFRHLVV